MIAATAAAKISGNITKENVEQVARLVQADPHCPEAAVFFNFSNTDAPCNREVRRWLYAKKRSTNLLKDVSMEDYLQAFSLYLIENMQTEWDSNACNFNDYFILTTRPHGKFCFALIKGYCDYHFDYRYVTDPCPSAEPEITISEAQLNTTDSEDTIIPYQAVSEKAGSAKAQKSKYVKGRTRILINPKQIHMNDIGEYSELTDGTDSIRDAEARMNMESLFADLGLSNINRDILIEYINNGNKVCGRPCKTTIPFEDIRRVILSRYGVILNNSQISQKIRHSTQKVRSRINSLDVRDYI